MAEFRLDDSSTGVMSSFKSSADSSKRSLLEMADARIRRLLQRSEVLRSQVLSLPREAISADATRRLLKVLHRERAFLNALRLGNKEATSPRLNSSNLMHLEAVVAVIQHAAVSNVSAIMQVHSTGQQKQSWSCEETCSGSPSCSLPEHCVRGNGGDAEESSSPLRTGVDECIHGGSFRADAGGNGGDEEKSFSLSHTVEDDDHRGSSRADAGGNGGDEEKSFPLSHTVENEDHRGSSRGDVCGNGGDEEERSFQSHTGEDEESCGVSSRCKAGEQKCGATFHHSSVQVDVVCSVNGQAAWISVSARSPRGQSPDDVANRMRCMLIAANAAQVHQRPALLLVHFGKGTSQAVAQRMFSMGATTFWSSCCDSEVMAPEASSVAFHGHEGRCGVEQPVPSSPEASAADHDHGHHDRHDHRHHHDHHDHHYGYDDHDGHDGHDGCDDECWILVDDRGEGRLGTASEERQEELSGVGVGLSRAPALTGFAFDLNKMDVFLKSEALNKEKSQKDECCLDLAPFVFDAQQISQAKAPSTFGSLAAKERLINLDTTALVAMVSHISNGGAPALARLTEIELRARFRTTWKFIQEQVVLEIQNPLLPYMEAKLEGRVPVCCEFVYQEFSKIASVIGGPKEKERATKLLARLRRVPDCPTTRILALACSGGVKERHKIVFGTGDALGAPTLSANVSLLRAVQQRGVAIFFIPHSPRALTGN